MRMIRLFAFAVAGVISACPALAQSSPGWATGFKPSAAQWNTEFASKQDVLTSGIVTASMLASGAAAGNLSTVLPNLSASVEGSGVPGMDGAHWYIWNGFSTFDPTPTLRVDRYVSGAQTGTYAGGPYYAGKFQTTTGVNEVAYEWPLFSQVINYTNASAAAQHVAVAGYMMRNPPPSLGVTTGASGTGSTATVTFSGSTVVPVGHSVAIAGVTPSGYNGNYKVTASSAGSVSFANATTGAQTVAGTVSDISLTSGWASNFVCTDQAGEPDPIMPCIAQELDSYTNYSGTDANKSRVTLQMMAGTGHISRGVLQGTKGGATYDRAYELDGTYGIGFDFTNGTFASPAIMLTNNQQICFDGTTGGACQRYMTYNGSSLIYQVPGGTAFSIGDGGTISLNYLSSPSGNPLSLYAASGVLKLGAGGTQDLYELSASAFYPVADNSRPIGGPSNRFSIGYFGSVGASGAPVSTVYAGVTYSTANAPTPSSCGTSPATAGGSNNTAGRVTTGTGAPTACTITFATAYPNNAFCTVTPASAYAGTLYISAQSASAFTVTLGTGTSSLALNYSCGGN